MQLDIYRTRSMTRKQASALRACLRKTLRRDVGGYEVKYFSRSDFSPEKPQGTSYFAWEIGLKGDEGTLASVFGRDSYCAVIGPKGGLTKFVQRGRGAQKDHDLTYRRVRAKARQLARLGY